MPVLIFTLLLLICVNPSRADVSIGSDFYFSLQQKDSAHLLLKQKLIGEENVQIPDWNIEGDYKSVIKNIQLNSKYAIQLTSDPSQLTSIQYQLSIPRIAISIEKVITDAVIYKNIGGIIAQIFLKGQCTGISVQSSKPVQLSGKIQMTVDGDRIGAKVESIDYQSLQDWTLKVSTCEGPQGYQEALEGEIRKILMDKNKVQSLLIKPFQDRVNKSIDKLNQQLFQERKIDLAENVSLFLRPLSLFLDDKRGDILVSGTIDTIIKDSTKNETLQVANSLSMDDFLQIKKTGFVISQKYVSELIKFLDKNKIAQYKFLAQQISSLKSLFKNRFFQFFLWPDLMNFPKNAPFQFTVKAKETPRFDFISGEEGYAWFQLNAKLQVETQAPQKTGKYESYGNFETPVHGKMWFGIYKGDLVTGFHKPKMSLKFLWNELYKARFNPFQFISVSYFGQKVQDYLGAKKIVYNLPEMQLNDVEIFKADSVEATDKWLQISYKP